ncbi:FtsW/RodA/SpoVE family cell cycle protein [Paenibacillus alvei]|uniref:FtsW/RodA/SpoVE family cell cycle protein n=1 Tax=Paenibacillus alvei TaxID=44250 RepID=A0AAP6ZZS9_PAEAL|nr:FtsW/RodA/SpoVE family cell cycle protein [Paenibacillus alvei]NOJ72949.1 FtsW/RodA/SpoVE family cell cycle protein [Paenibacillus alvei]
MPCDQKSRDTQHSSILEQFVGDVLAHVKAKQMHSEIRAELLDHLLNETESGMDYGMDEAVSAQQAVRNMGEPSVVAAQFNQVHRPKAPWKLWISVLVWIAICVLGLFAVQAGNPQDIYRLSAEGYAWRLVPGVVAFLFSFWVGYLKLQQEAAWIYGITLCLNVYTVFFPVYIIDGYPQFGLKGIPILDGIPIDIFYMSPYLYLLSLYSMWNRKPESPYRSILPKMVLFILPIIVFLVNGNLLQVSTYLVGGIIVLKLVGVKRKNIATVAGMTLMTGGLCYWFIESPGLMVNRRFGDWFEGLWGNGGGAYTQKIAQQLFREAGWFGNGVEDISRLLPYAYSENLTVTMVHMFGWAGGLVLIICLGVIIVTMYNSALLFRDPFARGIGMWVSGMMGIQSLLYIGGIIGIIPINGGGLPLLGADGGEIMLWMLMLGLYSSVHWKKDMVPVLNR